MNEEEEQTNQFIQEYIENLKQLTNPPQNLLNNLDSLQHIYTNILSDYTNNTQLVASCGSGYIENSCINVFDDFKQTRQEQLDSNAELIVLLNYLRQNIYSIKLLANSDPKQYVVCDASAISDMSSNLFMLDCNGDISANLDMISGFHLIRNQDNILVKNLNYAYQDRSVFGKPHLLFNYDLSASNNKFTIDPYIDTIYKAKADVSSSDGGIFKNEPVALINIDW